MTQAITQMEKVTQTTAATAEESAAASEELNSQAEMSMQTVGSSKRWWAAAASAARARRPSAGRAAPRQAANVVQMARSAKPAAAKAEDVIPFGETGTYGKF